MNHTINWVNDHIEICDRFDARVQLMQDYLDGKPDDFDGIAVKRFLLGQAREQVSWYRQSIDALDYVGCVACRRALGNRTTLFGALSAGVRLPGHRAWHRIQTRSDLSDLARTLGTTRHRNEARRCW